MTLGSLGATGASAEGPFLGCSAWVAALARVWRLAFVGATSVWVEGFCWACGLTLVEGARADEEVVLGVLGDISAATGQAVTERQGSGVGIQQTLCGVGPT